MRESSLPPKQFITQATVEGLGVTILPGTARFDKQRIDTHFPQELLDPLGRERRTLVAAETDPKRAHSGKNEAFSDGQEKSSQTQLLGS